MAVINTAAIAKQLEPGLNAIIGENYTDYPMMWKEVYTSNTTDRWREEDVAMSTLGLAQTMTVEAQPVPYDEMAERWTATYIPETVKLGGQITQEAMEDNLYKPLAGRLARALGRSFRLTKEIKAAAVFNNGFSTFKTGDNVALFSASHPITGATFSNLAGTASQLNETSLEDAIIAIQGFVDDRGNRINAMPKKMLVPRQLQFTVKRLLMSTGRTGTAENDINAVKDAMPYSVWQYLTSTTSWYILTDVPDGFKYFQRVPLKMGTEVVFDTDIIKYKGRERYVFGCSDPRAGWANAGA